MGRARGARALAAQQPGHQVVDGVVFNDEALRSLARLGVTLRAGGCHGPEGVLMMRPWDFEQVVPLGLRATVKLGCKRRVFQVVNAMFPGGETQCSYCRMMKPNTDFVDNHGETRTRCISCWMAAMAATKSNGGVLNTPSPVNDPMRQPGPVTIVQPGRPPEPTVPPPPTPIRPPPPPPSPTEGRSKTCSKCGVVKALDLFYSDRSKPDGRRSDCKVCLDSRKKFGTATKMCYGCKTAKSLSEFHKNKGNADGHHTHCKQCRLEGLDRKTPRPRAVVAAPVVAAAPASERSAAPSQSREDRLALAHLIVGEDVKVEAARERMEIARRALDEATSDYERALTTRDEALGILV